MTRFSSKAGTGPFWRLCSRFLFLEMQARQWRGPLSSKPYIRFERYFAHSAEHLERFQNFVAGNGILVDLLASNWFEYLPIRERVPVTSLFRRIYQSENVWLSYRNRPAIVDRMKTLDNVDQDSLPQSVFIVPVRSVGGVMGVWLKITKVFSVIGAAIENSFKAIFRAVDALFGAITLGLLSIPVFIMAVLGFASPGIQAWVTRSKINMLSGLRPNSKKIGGYLSRYETLFANDLPRTQKMSNILKKPAFRPFLTKQRLDTLDFNDRVLASSLMRRCAAVDPQFAGLLNAVDLNDAISVRSQRHVAQLNEPGAQQKSEWETFKKLNSGQKHKAASSAAVAAPAAAVRAPRLRPAPLSEAILKQDGWFNPLQKHDLEFSTALRERAYNDAAAYVNKAENFSALSPQMMTKAAAVMALLQKPFTHDAAKAEVDNSLLVPAAIRNRSSKEQAEKALSAALPLLYPSYKDEAARSPIACWTALEDALEDDTEFSYAAEVLTASYSGTAFNRITDRSVSFDTFMITRLEEILDKIRLWVDWDDCPTSALAAYAHAAASAGDRASFDFFIVTLDGRTGVPPRFIINLRDSFFNTGIHQLDAVLSPATAATETSQLLTMEKGKKYLCLVEMGARVQALRQIEGVSDKLLCGPVAPTDAIKFPAGATLVQAEDFIPMYSTEDMEIGKDIDRLTEHYLDQARKTLKTSGISELYEDAIEVTHATMFFALYRDAISARICEKLIKTAGKYDGVILLARNGQILGNMIAPAAEAVGRENVYLSLGSHRAPEFFGALTTMRAAAKSAKAKKPAPKTETAKTEAADSTEWMSGMGGWISDSMNFHGRSMQSVEPGAYSIMTLEHINGYYDSYQALIREGLPHSNVELFTSAANVQLNDHINEDGFAPYEGEHSLRHCVLRPRTPDARPWMTPFVQTLRGSFDGFKSPFLPHYHDMILDRAQAVFSQRLPQIMDAVSYFRARFAEGLPDYIFTGPNQHMISRAAAYCGKAAGVPVYDFLILANTNHPRYRPIIASYAYLYDPWYKDIYQSFFGLKEDQLRTAGPLFEYSERLTQEPNADYAAPRGKTHIVFFSQSANFDNSKIMLESICQATKDRKDIYITVKLHPHESPANVERYTQIAADNGIKGNIHVFHKGDAVALLNQADLVVQSFSNIGLDALLLKKPVITFKPKTDLKARIFLYEKDIGYVVSTKTTLTNKVKKFLNDPKDRKAMQDIAEAFAVENDHFLRGQNAARVMKSVQEDVIVYKAARES
ncbi:MAG: CDP-glycerol glycerophosphotransferase family protein [Hellea sp.]